MPHVKLVGAAPQGYTPGKRPRAERQRLRAFKIASPTVDLLSCGEPLPRARVLGRRADQPGTRPRQPRSPSTPASSRTDPRNSGLAEEGRTGALVVYRARALTGPELPDSAALARSDRRGRGRPVGARRRNARPCSDERPRRADPACSSTACRVAQTAHYSSPNEPPDQGPGQVSTPRSGCGPKGARAPCNRRSSPDASAVGT